MGKGFTLIELLVSVVIFMLVMIAVLALFDQGQWVYLHASRRANAQELARLALEQMERDVRMSGFGIPKSSIVGGTTRWLPSTFLVSPGKIYFRSDLDNRHSWVKLNALAGVTTISVEDPDLVCPAPNTSQIILVNNGRRWEPFTCTGSDAGLGTITVDVAPTADCPAPDCEVYSPEHIFYRLSNDGNNDGVCDNVAMGADPFCSIERAIVYGNDPTANSAVPPDTAFETLATNITSLQIETTGLLRITITVRERAMQKPGKYQDIRLTSEIAIRDNVY